MSTLVAVPSNFPGGLNAGNGMHFGHCDLYTLVEVEDKAIGNVTTLQNIAHKEGGCLAPVQMLAAKGVKVLLAGGMGMRPLSGFMDAGVEVYHSAGCSTVKDAVEAYIDGKLPLFGTDRTCKGHHGGGCHH